MAAMDPVCSVISIDSKVDMGRLTNIQRRLRFHTIYILPKENELIPENRRQDIEATRTRVDQRFREDIDHIQTSLRLSWQERHPGERASLDVVELDVLLTGRKHRKTVNLSPRIWFKCRNSLFEPIAREQLKPLPLGWMKTNRLGDKIEFGSEAPLFLATPISVPAALEAEAGQGIELPDGFSLYVNLEKRCDEDSQKFPACALLCSIIVKRHGKVKYSGMCRVGGALAVKGKDGEIRIVGVTTAHGPMDYFLATGSQARSAPSKKSPAARLLQTIGAPRTERLLPAKNSSRPATAKIDTLGMVNSETLNRIEWKPVSSFCGINWLGSGWEEVSQYPLPFSVSDPTRLVPDADFALLELGSDFWNTYKPSHDSGSRRVEGWLTEDQMPSGPVDIIVRNDLVVSGTLLSEIPYLYLRGRRFPTRKIKLDQPLGTSRPPLQSMTLVFY